MLFSTPFFLFLFLPVFFAFYWFVPAHRWVLLAGSLLFYGWGEPVFLFVVLASGVFDWILGKQISRHGPRVRWWVAVGVAANLALLVYAKYTVFAVANLNALFTAGGWKTWPVPKIALPLGVSFIVFEKITYVVDLFRKAAPPAKSLLDYLNYVFLFPKLLAGPIIKYHDIADQLSHPTHRYSEVEQGFVRFITGLGKKVLIADTLAPLSNQVFALSPTTLNTTSAWLGLACFTFQIYFDFSGYSDMAIGMGRMLGFRLMENFRDPYLATSFTDFWRRWHISLSTWIKEYLYVPLGGNRRSTPRNYFNLCLCFILCGLWHGAAWNFVTWGAIQGVALVCDRAFWLRFSERLPRPVNIALTFFAVALTWVFFRCDTLQHAFSFFRLLGGASSSRPDAVFVRGDTLVALVGAATLVLAPLVISRRQNTVPSRRIVALASALLVLLLSTGRMGVNSFQPFLYFRF
ncbi:MAG: MBOAT family O-acyltransferase [Chthoniobacterales bacterium]